ncbi:MAG: endonuclease/exonuclease/phosphatase family protein [Chthoniobacterales bacterium]|nr:endonuclease/exonuclease/phosphatase family protein [Chthoniobacterales bacterium]
MSARSEAPIVTVMSRRGIFAVCNMVATVLLPLSAVSAREFSVLTYNVENLFDADKEAIFEDYAETGAPNDYSPSKLVRKLQTIGKVLKSFNGGKGPEIACFNEFEMDFTPDSKVVDYDAFLGKYKSTTVEKMLTTGLNDEVRGLPVEALLLKYLSDEGMTGYHVAIGDDKPDFAALALDDRKIHKKGHKNAVFSKFPVTKKRSHPTPDARDILEVTLDAEGHPLHVFVNHWKSGAGDFNSEQSRRFNARTLRGRLDDILREDPSADIIVTGDFNSQYNQSQAYPFMGETGLNDILGSQGDESATASAPGFSLYNLWHELPAEQRRSDHFAGKWGTLMQQMITPGLYDSNGVQYGDNSFSVVMLDGVNTRTPLRLPRRWSNAGAGGGASDHFPVASRYRTVEENDKNARIKPEKPGTNNGQAEPLSVGFEALQPSQVGEFLADAAKNPAAHIGEIFLVRGTVAGRRPLAVEVSGAKFLLWSPDVDLRKRMQKFPTGSGVEFLAELDMHKGQFQFVVQAPQWLIKRPEAKSR